MALHSADTHIIKAATATESLPDPVTVGGRTLDLVNQAAVAAVWSSIGALPFQVDGVGLATLTVARGATLRVQSDGARWVLVRPTGSRAAYANTAVTDASGNATFTFAAGLFPAAPVVTGTAQFPASQNPLDLRITTLTATSCVINVKQSPTLVVLSLSVLGIAANIAGVTVHLLASPAGATP